MERRPGFDPAGCYSVALAFRARSWSAQSRKTHTSLGLSKVFIGVIFLSWSEAPPNLCAAMARKNKLDLTVGIAVGSSQQIARSSRRVLVLMSYAVAPKPMNLVLVMPDWLSSFSRADHRDDRQRRGIKWFKRRPATLRVRAHCACCYFLPNTWRR